MFAQVSSCSTFTYFGVPGALACPTQLRVAKRMRWLPNTYCPTHTAVALHISWFLETCCGCPGANIVARCALQLLSTCWVLQHILWLPLPTAYRDCLANIGCPFPNTQADQSERSKPNNLWLHSLKLYACWYIVSSTLYLLFSAFYLLLYTLYLYSLFASFYSIFSSMCSLSFSSLQFSTLYSLSLP